MSTNYSHYLLIVSEMNTRRTSTVYLLGSYQEEILGAKLPSYRQTFSYFLHLHKVEKKTVRDASRGAIQAILSFWAKAGIPVRAEQHCIQKLETLFTEWKGLQKHKSRPTAGHQVKEDAFVAHLDDLFDIAHSDALTRMTNPEDVAFLCSQRRKGRPGSLGAIDVVQDRRKKRAQERLAAKIKRQQRSKEEIEASSSKAVLASDSSSPSSSEEETGEHYATFRYSRRCFSSEKSTH